MALNLEPLFKSHFQYLSKLAYSIVRDSDDAQDIVQNVFLKLWTKKDTLILEKEAKAYLSKAVINASLDFVSKHQLRLSKTFTQNDQNTLSTSNKVQLGELEMKLESALQLLPDKCRAIFCLSRFEGMSGKEIASHLDLSKKTVDNQLGIALKKLRTELSEFLTLPSFPYHLFKFIFQKISKI
ncbi:MAG: RNA polymerase sigma-70 factor [Reichenbachiella sp.]